MFNKLGNQRGSLTAESAIGMTCFIFFVFFLLTFSGGLYIESMIEESLAEASLQVRAELPLLLPTATASPIEDLALQKLLKGKMKKSLEKRLDQRILFIQEDPLDKLDTGDTKFVETEENLMKLSVKVEWPIVFFENHPIEIERILYCKVFSSFRTPYKFLEKEGITTVYLANHPSVFHTNRNCQSIREREANKVSLNSLEGKYRECKFCQKERKKNNANE